MRYRLILILIVMVLSPASVWCQKITKETIVSEGKKRTYYLYVPANVKPDSKVPLVVLLHGSGRVGLSLAEKWKPLAQQEGFILVAPDSNDSAFWGAPTDGPDFLRDLVEATKSRYPINQRRVYLFGHSAGAVFGLSMALLESEYFAAGSFHAGALRDDGISLIKSAKRKTPLQIQVGDRDPFFPLKVVRETRDALNAEGFSSDLIEIPNHDHWYYDDAAKINLTAWTFLREHELPSEPLFVEPNFRKEASDPKKSKQSADLYNQGIARMQAGDFAAAITAFSRVIELNGKDADAYNNRGIAYSRQKNYDAAIADFTASLAARITDVAYNNRAAILLTTEKFDAAIGDLSEAIKITPSAERYANRGFAYARIGKEELAIADYERAIELDPRFGLSYVLRGLLELKKGQVESAQRDFDTGFKLDPALHAEFDQMINQLKAARGVN